MSGRSTQDKPVVILQQTDRRSDERSHRNTKSRELLFQIAMWTLLVAENLIICIDPHRVSYLHTTVRRHTCI
jgi:hypothetical protein